MTGITSTVVRSTATTNNSDHERLLSGCSSVFQRRGGSLGLRGSAMGTQLPSPSAPKPETTGPTSFGWNGGVGGSAGGLALSLGGGGRAAGAAAGLAASAFTFQ